MNRLIVIPLAILSLVALSTFNFQLSTFGQGSLTPPAPPAPTMKTLDQVEPRTIINAANTPGDSGNLFIITNSGSYYLATNLVGVSGKNGIEIITNNVTLDLNGFAVQGVPASSSGIYIPSAQTNITVRNGAISGWGSLGAYSLSPSSRNLVFERLNVAANLDGIFINGTGFVRDCHLQNNSSYGIICNGGVVSGCTAENNGAYGIYVAPGTVTGCFANYNTHSGIFVDAPGSVVIGNTCIANNTANSVIDAGIYVNDANNRVEGNHVTASGYAGISVSSGYTKNLIIKNSVIGDATNNYVFNASQIVGPIVTNTVSGIITNSNPWANFSF